MRKIKFSREEIRDLLKAWIAISIAFGIVLGKGAGINIYSSQVFGSIFLAALTVGIGFLLHELAHKFVAIRYGLWGEFRAWNIMLIFAILLALSPLSIVFAAPGAVFILGQAGVVRNGKISVAGPITNLILAVLFLLLLLWSQGWLQLIGQYGFQVNTWLALFNMIPVWNLDGKKVLTWDAGVYAAVVAVAIGFMVLNAWLV